MGRVADILERVRDSLSDSTGDRWSDARLLRLIDEAQKDLAKKSLLLREKIGVSLLADISVYELPTDTIHTQRFVNAEGEEIVCKTHEQMDKLDPGWEIRTGDEVEYIVYDKLNPRQFKIYPIITASDGGAGETFLTDDYGVVTAVDEDTVLDDYGVAASITTSATLTATWSSVYGVVTDESTIYQSIVVYYYRYPVEINAIDIAPSELEIDAIYDRALKLYVVGEALLDDKDTQDVTLGRSRKKEYREDRDTAKKDSSKDFTRAPRRRSSYNDGFN